jgi:hypothetical protein
MNKSMMKMLEDSLYAGSNRFDAGRASDLIPSCGLRVLMWIAICSVCLLIYFYCK